MSSPSHMTTPVWASECRCGHRVQQPIERTKTEGRGVWIRCVECDQINWATDIAGQRKDIREDWG